MKTVEQATAKWKTNTAGAGPAWNQGIQDSTVDVAAKAIAAKGAAAAGYQRAMTDGTYEKGWQQSGGTTNWKEKSAAKEGNYVTGVNTGADKQAASMAKLLPALSSIVAGLPARQPGNPAANLARVAGVVNGLHARKGQFKG